MSIGVESILITRQENECPFIQDNVRQGFVEHFQNLNIELVRANNHGYNELEELYHEGEFQIDLENIFRKITKWK
jgi:hypothetical protein